MNIVRMDLSKIWHITVKNKYLPEYFNISQFSVNLQIIIVKYSLYQSIVHKHDYLVYWLEQHLNYISAFSYSYCIYKRKIKDKLKYDKNMCSLMIDNSNEHDKTHKNTIYGGGQHQVSLNGEIVYKYLHHCTDTTSQQ